MNVWDLVFSTMPFILSVIFGNKPKEKIFSNRNCAIQTIAEDRRFT